MGFNSAVGSTLLFLVLSSEPPVLVESAANSSTARIFVVILVVSLVRSIIFVIVLHFFIWNLHAVQRHYRAAVRARRVLRGAGFYVPFLGNPRTVWHTTFQDKIPPAS